MKYDFAGGLRKFSDNYHLYRSVQQNSRSKTLHFAWSPVTCISFTDENHRLASSTALAKLTSCNSKSNLIQIFPDFFKIVILSIRLLIFAILVGLVPIGFGQTPEPIRTAQELRTLSPTEAAARRPVRLQATVTQLSPERSIFIQDSTGGAFLSSRRHVPSLYPGLQIEVEGVSYPGLYVPGIEPTSVRVIGEGPLPAPRAVTMEQLAAGTFHYERVEVRGIVRAFQPVVDGPSVLTLALGDSRLDVHLAKVEEAEASALIDATVRVTGLAAGYINDRRQLVAPHLRVSDLTAVQVEEAAPAEPFALEPTPASNLLRFRPGGAPGHRVKVTGIVTHHAPGSALFLRDGPDGLLVETLQRDFLPPGTQIEVLGFADMGTFNAVLRDAIFRTVESGPTPVPTTTKPAEILKGTHEADLVRLEANLVETFTTAKELILVLREGELGFRATLALAGLEEPPALRAGSRLQLTGVALAEQTVRHGLSFRANPTSFSLLLRSSSDIAILHAAPWWTPTRLLLLAAAAVTLGLIFAAWAWTLQRRVREQTAIIAEKVKAEAAAEERARIAREFHDTLEQELVGLALRLDAAAPKIEEPARTLIDAARRLVQRLQAGARGFLWNLRDRSLEQATLADAIQHTLAALGEDRTLNISVTGESRRLPGVTEHELLRLAQEASTNAVKHGRAQTITIALAYEPRKLQLTIADDGSGFDPSQPPPAGHFGLIGMRERVQHLGGTFTLQSAPGAGTTVTVVIPLPA